MKIATNKSGKLYDEYQALISYLASKASPSDTAQILYNKRKTGMRAHRSC